MKKREPWICQDCRVMMQYIEGDDMYRCPVCGAELWPGDTVTVPPNDEIGQLMAGMAKSHEPRECLPAGDAAIGGGGASNSGRNTDGGKKKKTPQQLYNQLFKET